MFEEHLGCCEAFERVHLQKCQVRDKNTVGVLFSVCRNECQGDFSSGLLGAG